MKQKLIELLEEVLERLDPNDIHNPALISKVEWQIHELKSDEIHVSWVPYGTVRLECSNGIFNTKDVEEVRYLSKLQESAEELPYAVRNLNLPDLDDEELDRLAREEVESSLYEDGIIEDPDCDGGLLG